MRFLVTGANGYVGRWVVQALTSAGHQVLEVSRHKPSTLPQGAEWKILDVLHCTQEELSVLGEVDGLIHLAWQDGFSHNAPSHMDNLPNHYHFLEMFAKMGCQNMTVIGTMHEIGYYEGCVDAQTPCHPRSLYGIAKNALREAFFLLAEQYDIRAKWPRAYYICGDDEKNNSIFSKIIQWEKEGKETFAFTSGKNEYDFIQVEELGLQLALLALHPNATGIYNTCSGTPTPLRDQVEIFLKQNQFAIRPEYGKFPDRAYDSPRIWGDATAILDLMKEKK